MTDTRTKYAAPAINKTAFNCPHCHVLTTQWWYRSHLQSLKADQTPPRWAEDDVKNTLKHYEDNNPDAEGVETFRQWTTKVLTRRPFASKHDTSTWVDYELGNTSVSQCYHCKELTLWIDDRVCWPVNGEAPPANPDLPASLRADYDEASSILHLSPRGAAALLRVVIEKLCSELGEKGRLDNAIGSLVAKGLDQRVAIALDIVRVIGNNAVHPGKMDIEDDRAVAENLFKLVNLIVDKMISEPKHLDEMYESLPEGARKHIEKRDHKKTPNDTAG